MNQSSLDWFMEKVIQWGFIPLIFVAVILKFHESSGFEVNRWEGFEKRRQVLSKHNRRLAPRQIPVIIEGSITAFDFSVQQGLLTNSRSDQKLLKSIKLKNGAKAFLEIKQGEVVGVKLPLIGGGKLEILREDTGRVSISKEDPILIIRSRDVSGIVFSSLADSLKDVNVNTQAIDRIYQITGLNRRARVFSYAISFQEEIYGNGDVKSQNPVAIFLNTSSGEIARVLINGRFYGPADINAKPVQWFTKPVAGKITSPFSQSRLHPILGFRRPHPAIDISAPYGTPVKAAGSGTVSFAGWYGSSGNMVKINHGNNVETVYRHLSKISVRRGQKVEAGTVIGNVGSTGLSTGPHLCFSVLVAGKFVDPVKFRPFWGKPTVDKQTAAQFQRVVNRLKGSANRLQLAQRRLSGIS